MASFFKPTFANVKLIKEKSGCIHSGVYSGDCIIYRTPC